MSKEPTDQEITQQAERLLVLPGVPGEAVREIAVALKRHSKTAYHARQIVQVLLDSGQFFPSPANIRDAAAVALSEPPPKFRTPNPKCSVCTGSGYAVVERNGAHFADTCPCRVPGATMPADAPEPTAADRIDSDGVIRSLPRFAR